MSEKNNNLIAYCGLYCGDCPIHKGKIADLLRDLRKELRDVRFDKTAEALSKTRSLRHSINISSAMKF